MAHARITLIPHKGEEKQILLLFIVSSMLEMVYMPENFAYRKRNEACVAHKTCFKCMLMTRRKTNKENSPKYLNE